MGDGVAVYLNQGEVDKVEARAAEFRSIGPGGAGRNQIDVSRKDAGTIQVRGNGIDGTLVLWNNSSTTAKTSTVLIGWVDGLVTTAGQVNFEVSDDTHRDAGAQ